MKRWLADALAIAIVAVVVGLVGAQVGRRSLAPRPAHEPPAPTGPKVRVAPIERGSLSADVVAYGQVVPIPSKVNVYSFPLESRVVAVMVTAGQRVAKGDTLLEVEPSPDTALALTQARDEFEYANRAFELASQRLTMKLATEAEAAQARNAMMLAKSKLDNLLSRGLQGQVTVKSEEDGVVSASPWTAGAIISPGASIIEVVPAGSMQVTLQIEVEDADLLAKGDPVALAPVERGRDVVSHGVIRAITRRVDPATRLVNVAVDLKDGGLLLQQYVQGTIRVSSREGLIAPRSALIARADSHVIYVVQNNVARERTVAIVVESGPRVMIAGADIAAGDQIVVEGAAGLRDGMTVEVQP